MNLATAAGLTQRLTRGTALLALGALVLDPSSMQAQRVPSETTTPQRIMQIGEDEASFIRISEVVASKDGRIFVLDAREPAIKVFSKSGTLTHSIGRSGAGPGEFTHPAQLQVGDQTLTITDWMQRRTSTFTLEGKHIETRRYESPTKDGLFAIVRPVRGGSALLLTSPSGTNSRRDVTIDLYSRVVFSSSDGASLDTLLAIRGDVALWRMKGSWIANFLIADVGDGGAWALSGDSLLATAD
jgi:hypothetical protein